MNRARNGIVICAILVLSTILPVFAAAGDSAFAVTPALHWDPDQRVLAAGYPPLVVAWMRGEIDDPDGSLASWKERYDRQITSPGFGQALLALQNLVRRAVAGRDVSAFEVDSVIVPALLSERLDIAAGLRGGPATMGTIGDGDCFKVYYGAWKCLDGWVWTWFGKTCAAPPKCVGGEGNECSFWVPIPCPDDEDAGNQRATPQP